MSDKILKEAYDKLTAIEEGERDDRDDDDDGRFVKCPHCGTVNDTDDMRGDHRCEECGKNVFDESIEETSDPSILHDAAINFLDDMLASLSDDEQYSEKGDVIRYAIKRLQEVGLGR